MSGEHRSDFLMGQSPRRQLAKPVVVMIEDKPQLRRLLRRTLTSQGYRLLEASTGTAGLLKVSTRPPDIVLLDLRLPDMDAVEFIRRLRQWTLVPIIVLSAPGDNHERVAALDAGGDDCVDTPFSVDELVARIRVALRRSASVRERGARLFHVGDLVVDVERRCVTVGGKHIHLTPIEYKMLTILVRHAGKVVTHSQLLNQIWGPTRITQLNYVRVYMTQLRHKLEGKARRPRYLLTEPLVGYRLTAE